MSSNVDLRGLAIDRSDAPPAAATGRPRALTRYLLPAILLLGLLTLLAWAARDLVFPPRAVTVVPIFSTTAEVQQAGTPLFKAAGWVEPRPTLVRVAALAPGVIEELLVVEDQAVEANQPIAELVKEDAQLAYDLTLADLELRQAELAQAEADRAAAVTRFKQPVHLQAALAQADAALAKIQTELKNLPFQLRRAKSDAEAMQKDYAGKLASKGVIAGIKIEIAKSKADAAAALVEELQDRDASLEREQKGLAERRDALRTQLELLADETQAKDTAGAKVRAATARVSQAAVAVAEAKLRLDRMTVRAPIAGRVYQLIGEPGSTLAPGASKSPDNDGRTVVTLYRPEMLQARVDVRFEDIPKVSLDQPVEIANPALPKSIVGRVLFVGSEADIQKNTLEVKVALPADSTVFKPDMLVDVTFQAPESAQQPAETSQEVKFFTLPSLVHQAEGGSFVWLADQAAGVARKVNVQTGSVGSNGLMRITGPLTLSSRIIASNSTGLTPGARIRVTHEDPSLGTSPAASTHSGAKPMNRLPTGETP